MLSKYVSTLAAMYNGRPAQSTFVILVVGSVGKTTTAKILNYILQQHVGSTALCSHKGCYIGTQEVKKISISAFGLQSFISQAKAGGCQTCIFVLRESDLQKGLSDGLMPDMTIITNILTDDLHEEEAIGQRVDLYHQLLLKQISGPKGHKLSVLPKDCRYTKDWGHDMAFSKSINFGILSNAAVRGEDIQTIDTGIRFVVRYLNAPTSCTLPTFGEEFVYDVLAVVATGLLIGLSIESMMQTLSGLHSGLFGGIQLVSCKGTTYHVLPDMSLTSVTHVFDTMNALLRPGKRIIMVWIANHNMIHLDEQYSSYVKQAMLHIYTQDGPIAYRPYRLQQITDWMRTLGLVEGDTAYVIPTLSYAMTFVQQIATPGDQVMVMMAHKKTRTLQVVQELLAKG